MKGESLPQQLGSALSHWRGSSSSSPCAAAVMKGTIALFLLLVLSALSYSCWLNASIFSRGITATFAAPEAIGILPQPEEHRRPHPHLPLPPITCPSTACHPPPPPPSLPSGAVHPPPVCPEYFRWIHEDLRPWKTTGITREAVERARGKANFRLVVVGGRAHVEVYHRSFQTRDVGIWWGILQLLRRYPGRLPDLDLMFYCDDLPVINAAEFTGEAAPLPPPLFGFCKDDATLDIPFPDWSFWGWAETNIKPWATLSRELKEANQRVRWVDREPYAYWKGNKDVAPRRRDLFKCNASDTQDWSARLYVTDWGRERNQGFKQSSLADQCTYRYKIYVEGISWSVSSKYILACDSPTLLIKPRYYDFFSRGLVPLQHYWPIRADGKKCRSIDFAVKWGNSHKKEAEAMGKEGSDFINEKLKMDYVYDYMFHLLNEYAKLLRYNPTVPQNATKLSLETMLSRTKDRHKEFMMESMVNLSQSSSPCTLHSPLSPTEMKYLLERKESAQKKVDTWEQEAEERKNKNP